MVQRTGLVELGDPMCGLKGQIMVILRSNEADCESVWLVRQTESIENLHELHGITWGHFGSTGMMVDDFKMISSLLWNINFILDLFISPKPKVNCNFEIRQSKISVPKISGLLFRRHFANVSAMTHSLWVIADGLWVISYDSKTMNEKWWTILTCSYLILDQRFNSYLTRSRVLNSELD